MCFKNISGILFFINFFTSCIKRQKNPVTCIINTKLTSFQNIQDTYNVKKVFIYTKCNVISVTKNKGKILEKCSSASTKQNPPLDWPLELPWIMQLHYTRLYLDFFFFFFLPCLFVMLPFLPIFLFILKTRAQSRFFRSQCLFHTLTVKWLIIPKVNTLYSEL